MPRHAVTESEREHGRLLGSLIALRRNERHRSAAEVARDADVSLDAIRSLETGRVATPAFLTVARIATTLGLSLDDLHAQATADGPTQGAA